MWLLKGKIGNSFPVATWQVFTLLNWAVTLSAIVLILFFLMLGACSSLSGPEYERPSVVEKDAWTQQQPLSVNGAETIRLDWWRNFNDPYLDSLMLQALSNNSDLRILSARVGVAEAAIGQANAAQLPTIDAALGANYLKAEGGDLSRSYSQAFAIGWEADIWGKLKKGVSAQSAEFNASEADWRAGYLTLASNVSSTYFKIRQFDEQIVRQQKSLDKSDAILSIFTASFREGLAPKTQVLQQQAEVNRLGIDLLELQRLRQLSENALATLLGVPAGDLTVPAEQLSDSVKLIKVPGGLPADLLSRRPDIVAAEYRVLQAHELEGQARLAKLPGFSLTANTGNTSLDLIDLLKSWTFGLTPTVNIPIFDPGVNARLRVSEAQSKLVVEEYRATVMRALEEVERALVNLTNRNLQRSKLLERQAQLRLVTLQIEAQLEEGLVTQLQVFESERSLLSTELALLENYQNLLSDTVSLYKALGGGWPPLNVGEEKKPG